MEKAINQRIADTGIFVFGYDSQKSLFTYSRPFNPEEAKALAGEVNQAIKSQYGDAKGLRNGLSVSESTGELINMNTFKGIVANRLLMEGTKDQQWLPTIKELIQLQKQGMLPSGVLIDGGVVLYDDQYPDKEIAQSLSASAREKGYVTPVLASFRSLGLVPGGEIYGVTPIFVSVDGLISGDEAGKVLDKNSFYKGDSGVRRLCRDCGDGWSASWNGDLGDFTEVCRVGRFSATGSAQKLEQEALGAFAPIRKSLDSIFRQIN